jgi:hypothetical protein
MTVYAAHINTINSVMYVKDDNGIEYCCDKCPFYYEGICELYPQESNGLRSIHCTYSQIGEGQVLQEGCDGYSI